MSAAWWPKLRERWIDAHARVGGGEAVEQLGGAVGAAVVDEDQLVVEARERGRCARDEVLDELLLVVDRRADAEQRGGPQLSVCDRHRHRANGCRGGMAARIFQ